MAKQKSELSNATRATRRGLGRMLGALPLVARVNWRNIVMPWRMLPAPVALALIGLVALAMVLDNGEDVSADVYPPVGQGVVIGADTVAPGTRCAEDEVITYRVLMGGQGVGCVHYEYVIMEFVLDCLIGNSEHGDNLASYHLRDQAFRSWCDSVIDDATDGYATLADLLIDTSSTVAPSPSATVSTAMGATVTPTPMLPDALPVAGIR